MRTITHDLRDTLEGREIEIYALLCQNLSNREIAERTDIAFDTVRWHLRNIYRKLGVEARNSSDGQSARRRAILYAGTKIEQLVSYENKSEKIFTLAEIRYAAKKVGYSLAQIEDIVSFLEMEK